MPVPVNYRWLFEDPVLATSYRVPFNPNKMTSPIRPRTLSSVQTIRVHWRIREDGAKKPYEWTFSGVIRTIDHHNQLLLWSRKNNVIYITDHLGRTFHVIPVRFSPNEKRPSATVTAKFDYDFTVLVLGRTA